MLDFVIPSPGESLLAAFDKWSGFASEATCDYSFHVAITWWSDQVKEEMGILSRERGVNSFKHFMAYKGSLMLSDQGLLDSFARCKELGCIPTVHCENGELVIRGQKAMLEKGILGPEGHPWSRPAEVEGEAANRVAIIAKLTNVPVYLVHCSCKQAVEVLRTAREAGQPIFGEALAGHLTIDDSVYYKGTWAQAASYVMSPPFRPAMHQEALWAGLQAGLIQTTATDNCTFCADQKAMGQNDFTKIPNGTNGVEDRMSILYTHGVAKGRLSLSEYVAVTSTNSAKIFGLYPRKGLIAAGSDADIVVIDPTLKRVISAKTHHQAIDSNIWEGWEVSGVTTMTISRGEVVWRAKVNQDGAVDWKNGTFTAKKGRGIYLARQPYPSAYDRVSLREAQSAQVPIKRV